MFPVAVGRTVVNPPLVIGLAHDKKTAVPLEKMGPLTPALAAILKEML